MLLSACSRPVTIYVRISCCEHAYVPFCSGKRALVARGATSTGHGLPTSDCWNHRGEDIPPTDIQDCSHQSNTAGIKLIQRRLLSPLMIPGFDSTACVVVFLDIWPLILLFSLHLVTGPQTEADFQRARAWRPLYSRRRWLYGRIHGHR